MIYAISYKTVIGLKPLCIRFDKILLGPEKQDVICNRIRYLLSIKRGITDVFVHYYAKIKVDSYDCLPIEKKLTLHNVIFDNA